MLIYLCPSLKLPLPPPPIITIPVYPSPPCHANPLLLHLILALTPPPKPASLSQAMCSKEGIVVKLTHTLCMIHIFKDNKYDFDCVFSYKSDKRLHKGSNRIL